MLGSKYLVAPVIKKNSNKKLVKFPKGIWLRGDNGKVYGPTTKEFEVPLDKVLFFEKISE